MFGNRESMNIFLIDKFIFLCCGLFWLELSFLPMITDSQARPDLFAVFLTFYAFQINRKHLALWGFLLGFLKDVFGNSFFGLETASYVSGAVLLQFISDQFDRDKRWIHLISVFLFCFFTLSMFTGLKFLVYPFDGVTWIELREIFMISIFSSVLSFFLFPLLEKWLKQVLHQKQYELF